MTSKDYKGPPIGVIKELNEETTPKQAILHVYRSLNEINYPTTTTTTTCTTNPVDQPDLATKSTLCTLSIPSYMSLPDFLNFVAPVDSFVYHYRVLCDATPQQYMVLMTFKDNKTAQDYYKQYNNRKYSSMEDDICQVVYLKSIIDKSSGLSSFPFGDHEETLSDGIANCPVCLDPMDETLNGLLTISCQHTFHVSCLSQWGDGSCPVCRYSQKSNNGMTMLMTSGIQQLQLQDQSLIPSSHLRQQQQNDRQKHMISFGSSISNSFQDDFANECQVCGCTDDLWMCLVCGQIGCGRAKNQGEDHHALGHYETTSHLYALEIETQRVWDYAGNGYVHRLIQNVVDGKLVELPPNYPGRYEEDDDFNNEEVSELVQGKLNAMSLEYSYLLTSQLDSQRMYYEDRIDKVMEQLSLLTMQCKEATTEWDGLERENRQWIQQTDELDQQIKSIKKENMKLEQKVTSWKDKIETMHRNYLEEKELTSSISHNNDLVKTEIQAAQSQLDAMTEKSMELMACLEMEDGSH
ncbi:uncharacterized protein BX664DRAFT_153141 [Halteromyces radiatus]|uniref:uncharacterized protein n=1 Tax=Halteromyces radiatus TaxID=101107 RepID=UPI002220481C|nr:uncharacterized protein BX664DRAFT_153141 [Halteromyces radiatus]KAI8086223.1 hypothetical protein BX664DRAFT_153141 [Halteromyces radiatus]